MIDYIVNFCKDNTYLLKNWQKNLFPPRRRRGGNHDYLRFKSSYDNINKYKQRVN